MKALSSEFLRSFNILDWGYSEEVSPISYFYYEKWVQRGDYGPLLYLADHRKDLRQSLKKYYSDCESALIFLFDYSKEKQKLDNFYQSEQSNGLKISSYVFAFDGEDYHQKIRSDLNEIYNELKKEIPSLEAKLSLDIQPVLERDLAYRAGLGWFGKNSMFINREHGSFFLIGSLLLNQKIKVKNNTEKKVETDHCGQCTACIDACPTDAIDPSSRTIKASRCISTFTIEMFKEDAVPPKGMDNSNGEIFGCDICQDVCPWNKRVFRKNNLQEVLDFPENSLASNIKEFFLVSNIEKIIDKLNSLSNRGFSSMFKGSPLERTGKRGLLKNLQFYLRKKS